MKMLAEEILVLDHVKRLCAIANCDPKHLSKDITALVRACYEDAAKLCIDKTDAEAIRRWGNGR